MGYRRAYGQMDSVIGRNVLLCSSRYDIRRDDILNSHFQPCDIYSYFHANAESSVLGLLPPLFELLQCRDGSLSLSSDEFCMVDISSMIASLCTC